MGSGLGASENLRVKGDDARLRLNVFLLWEIFCQEIKYINFAVDVLRVRIDSLFLFGTVAVSANRQQWSSDSFMGGTNLTIFHVLQAKNIRREYIISRRMKNLFAVITYKKLTQSIEVKVGITFQDGDRFNSCQVIYSQFGLAIHQNDHQARRRFVEWAQNEIVVVPDFHKRILFSDEAHFWLNGYVNKQKCRIWSEANPQVYVKTPLHPEKLTVWCALWAGGIIGPYFFKNDEGHNVTVNGDWCRAMITNFFTPELNNHDVQELWFQQDGATCHTARATIDLLRHVW
ncbi:hypothetical protein TNCV_4428651 [Trichonephila clavipes]|nr:hypothetical protein TNCV_4428651 [Trichonephila clavipes]